MDAASEIAQLRRSVRIQQRLIMAIVGTGTVLALAGFTDAGGDTLRVKGIVVEDSQGRARIVIGAPAPAVDERLRTSLARQQEAFGWIYPDPEQQPAVRLQNQTFGILILDENGHDRVAMGAPLPDPLNGRRIGPAYGFSVHDDDGIERAGLGHIKDKEKGLDRVAIGLDGRDGEGVIVFVDKDGTAGVVARDNRDGKQVFTGVAPAGSVVSPLSMRRRIGTLVTGPDGDESFRSATD